MSRSLHARLLAAVLATATLAGACGALDSDGDAIPDQIGDGDRAAISEVLSGWLEALNRSDLTTAAALRAHARRDRVPHLRAVDRGDGGQYGRVPGV